MKNSVSEQSFYIESSEEEEEEQGGGEEPKEFSERRRRREGCDNDEDDAVDVEENESTDSDVDSMADNNRKQSKPASYNTSWPQSYRQSIDLYSSVPSPSITFLGTPTLSRLGSSFLSTSLTRRHTPESLPGTIKQPLLHKVDDDYHQHVPPQRRSSHTLLPPIHRRSSIRKEEKSSRVSHELPVSRQSSFGQAVLNGMNVLCGVGILSTPFAAKQGGWLGMSILLIFAVLSFYTGMLLRYCLDSQPELETYPDIGQAAFGTAGRVAISIVLYVELYACCVEYIILEGDNLSSLFPNAHLSLGGLELDAHRLFAIMITLAVLPTVWLRDLSILSYISAGGVVASVLVVCCLFWTGLVDHVGIHSKGTTLNLRTLPVAIGLYGYCYSGHAVFPNIYSSMAQPNKYSAFLLTCFGLCTVMYAGVAIMGYTMFGESTLSQFTLNMPQELVATKIAVWTTVVNPFTKYALTMSPVALSLEELIPSNHMKSHIYAIGIRTVLVISTLFVGLSIPFFGLVMSLIGSLLTMLVTLILPCLCFLRILKGKVTRIQVVICSIVIAVGTVSAVFGSYSAITKIIENLRS